MSVAALAWTTIPFVPLTRTEATCPPPPSMVIALVMVSAPNPPGSRASISPPGAVLEIAPAKVLQGAVRLHGLASSPTPDTQVRLAWALAKLAPRIIVTTSVNRLRFTRLSFQFNCSRGWFHPAPDMGVVVPRQTGRV